MGDSLKRKAESTSEVDEVENSRIPEKVSSEMVDY